MEKVLNRLHGYTLFSKSKTRIDLSKVKVPKEPKKHLYKAKSIEVN